MHGSFHLPALAGARLRLASLAWFAAAALTIGVTVAGIPTWNQYGAEWVPAFHAAGLGFRGGAPGGFPVWPLPGGAAERAGVPAGVVAAVDGVPVPADASAGQVAALLRGPRGAPVRVAVRGMDGVVRERSVVRQSPDPAFWRGSGLTPARRDALSGLVSLLYAAGFLAAGALLFARRARDPVALIASLGMVLLASQNTFAARLSLEVPAIHPVLVGMRYTGLVLGLWFLCVFPDGRFTPRWTRAWAVLLPGVVAIGVFLVRPASAAAEVALLTAVLGIGVAGQLQRYRGAASAVERQQTKWALLGAAAALSLNVAGGLLLPLLPVAPGSAWDAWRNLAEWALTGLGLLLIPAGLAVSLLRYRLWDADAVLSRSAAYALLTLLLAAAWAALNQGAQVTLNGVIGTGSGTAAAVAAGLTALLFTPAHDRLRRWADGRFLRELVEFRERLPIVVGDLRETEDLDGLLAVVLARTCAALHCGRAAVFLLEEDGRLSLAASCGAVPDGEPAWGDDGDEGAPVVQDWRDPGFPVRVRLAAERGGTPTQVGWLALGPRPDGSGYSGDELEALTAVAGPVARAAWIVRARAERDDLLERRLRAAEDELRRVRHELALRMAASTLAGGPGEPA
jgi:hypothetical protein